jgi:putative sterol carrier protein
MTIEPMEVFTEPWVRALREAINRNPDFRKHGATWDKPIALEMTFTGSAAPRVVELDLHRGACNGARCSSSTDAELVIRSSAGGWRKILGRKMDPIWGIMSGQMRLIRGSLAELFPYALAAKALVESAASIDAGFPPEKGP